MPRCLVAASADNAAELSAIMAALSVEAPATRVKPAAPAQEAQDTPQPKAQAQEERGGTEAEKAPAARASKITLPPQAPSNTTKQAQGGAQPEKATGDGADVNEAQLFEGDAWYKQYMDNGAGSDDEY